VSAVFTSPQRAEPLLGRFSGNCAGIFQLLGARKERSFRKLY
jgi:hypothetical protein